MCIDLIKYNINRQSDRLQLTSLNILRDSRISTYYIISSILLAKSLRNTTANGAKSNNEK
jgi:hypothetical protein